MWPLWIFVMPISPGGLLPGPKEPGIAKGSTSPGEHWPSQPISVIPQLLMEGGTVPLKGIAQGPWRCQQAQLQSPCPTTRGQAGQGRAWSPAPTEAREARKPDLAAHNNQITTC